MGVEAGMEARGWMLEAGKYHLFLIVFIQYAAYRIQDRFFLSRVFRL
jgi:hypothetical protein